MSVETNSDSRRVECTRIDITPAEAPYFYIPHSHKDKQSENDPNRGFNKEAWNRKRTPSEIEHIEYIDATRERVRVEDYVVMCMKHGCKMYGVFDKCEHTIVRMRNTTVLFSKP